MRLTATVEAPALRSPARRRRVSHGVAWLGAALLLMTAAAAWARIELAPMVDGYTLSD